MTVAAKKEFDYGKSSLKRLVKPYKTIGQKPKSTFKDHKWYWIRRPNGTWRPGMLWWFEGQGGYKSEWRVSWEGTPYGPSLKNYIDIRGPIPGAPRETGYPRER